LAAVTSLCGTVLITGEDSGVFLSFYLSLYLKLKERKGGGKGEDNIALSLIRKEERNTLARHPNFLSVQMSESKEGKKKRKKKNKAGSTAVGML